MKSSKPALFVICIGFCLLLFFIDGCVSTKQPPPKIDYYTLEYESEYESDLPVMDLSGPVDAIVRVERFQVAPYYNTTNIIYKDKSFKRDAYHYHKWRANPGDLVTYYLARDLRNSGLFKGIHILSSKHPASHAIDGTLDRFYQERIDGSWLAVLSMNITLMKEFEPDISKRILFQKAYSIKKECSARNPRALAEGMSLAMADLSGRIIADVYGSITKPK